MPENKRIKFKYETVLCNATGGKGVIQPGEIPEIPEMAEIGKECHKWSQLMNVGTKSVLVGAHQFIWHPITVFFAWCELYGLPSWKELVCIIIHDLGYYGLTDMDGNEGKHHPIWAGRFAHKWLDGYGIYYGDGYSALCLYHSRYTAENLGGTPSKLCWADKLCVKFDPWWLYLPRVIFSGEIKEYRQRAADFGSVPLSASHREWYNWAQTRMIGKAYQQDARPAYKEGS